MGAGDRLARLTLSYEGKEDEIGIFLLTCRGNLAFGINLWKSPVTCGNQKD